ncbi:hypothetical protein [Bacillus subtilis]|nr:hypothetical protein [Bacillus subtilis]
MLNTLKGALKAPFSFHCKVIGAARLAAKTANGLYGKTAST